MKHNNTQAQTIALTCDEPNAKQPGTIALLPTAHTAQVFILRTPNLSKLAIQESWLRT